MRPDLSSDEGQMATFVAFSRGLEAALDRLVAAEGPVTGRLG